MQRKSSSDLTQSVFPRLANVANVDGLYLCNTGQKYSHESETVRVTDSGTAHRLKNIKHLGVACSERVQWADAFSIGSINCLFAAKPCACSGTAILTGIIS